MKALAKLERAPGLALTRVKKPEVGHNDVLIRIRTQMSAAHTSEQIDAAAAAFGKVGKALGAIA